MGSCIITSNLTCRRTCIARCLDTRRGGGNLRRGFTKMISYGSQRRSAEMPCDNRSHQLGKGQAVDALMPKGSRPSRPVYGSQQDCTPMSPCDRSHQLGKGQPRNTGMSVVVHPSRQLGEGQDTFAEMPYNKRPSQPV